MMKKRKLLTYLSILIIMMMVPIGAKAENNVYLHGDHFSGSTGWANTKTNYGSGSDWYVIVDASTMENNSIYGWGLKADNVSWSADGKTVDMTSSSSEGVTWSSTSTTNNSLKHSSSYKAYKVHLTKSNGNWTSVFTGYTYDLIQFKGGYNSWNPSDFNYNSTTGEYTFDIPASSVTGNFEFGILINGQWNGNSSSPTMDMTGGFQSLNTTQGGNMKITYSNSYTSYTVKVKKESGTWKVAVIGNTPTANITFSPTSTTFSTSTLNVTLTSSNSRDIYYTLDGTTPTTSSSHVTSGTAVTVTGTTTLTAGVLNSAGTALEGISSQTYTYNGGTVSTGYYLVGDLNSFGRRYNDTEWSTKSWDDYGAINKVLKFKDNGDGTYSLRIPAAHPAENDSEWRKVSKEKENVSYQFVIAPDNAFSGSEHTGDLYTIGNDSDWRSAWGLALGWEQVLRPQDTTTMDNNTPSGNMGASGSNNWIVKMNGGSYTITINPTNGTWSVTNDNTTHVMYFITKQDGKWRASYLTDVAESGTYDNDYGNKSGELSEFPNYSGSTVYVAHNWYEHGDQKNFSTKPHLSILGSHSSNGDLAPVTWINAKSGATAKSIFPTPGRYSTHIDPTRGNTSDLNSTTLQNQKIITNSNYPSIGDFTGNKGNAALIDPDATLSPETTTWDNYTLNDSKALTVTMNSHATGYKYSFGASSIPSTSGTSTAFGNLSYDGINVKLGDDIVASNTNTLTIRIQGTDGTNDGTIHSYTYTFNAASVALDFSPKSGFYINSATINVVGGTLPYTYQVKDGSGNVLSTGTIAESSFRISTPGYLTVEDSNNGSAVSDDPFDFTYSTSENYANYYNNGTTAQSVAQAGGKEATNIFLKKADYQNMRIYAWDYTYDNLIKAYQNGESTAIDSELAELGVTHDGGSDWSTTKDAFNERDPLVMLSDKYPGTLMSDSRSIKIDGEDYYYLTLPLTRLHANGDEVGVIVTRNDTDPTDLSSNADIYKTGDNHVTGNSSFIYSSYEDPRFTSPTGDNVLFFNNSNNWTKVKVYLWSGEGESKVEKTTWANAEEMSATATAGIYSYDAGAAWENVIFYNGDNTTNKTGDLPYGGGRVYYKPDGTHKTTYINGITDISDAVAGTNVLFYKNTANWSTPKVYLYNSDSDKKTSWDNSPEMKKFYGNVYYYALPDNETWTHVIFRSNGGDAQTGNLNYGGGRKMYEGLAATGDAGTVQEGNSEYITYIQNPSSYTVEVQNHPNGDDYLKAVPYDKTILLDPTWNGEITPKELSDEETSVPSWNGVEGNVSGYRKFVNKNLTQTIYGLDNSKTYTVQAIVRVWGEQNAKVTLKVGNGTAVDSKALNSSGISYVNKNGRVDDLYTQGPDADDPYFLKYNNNVTQGFGWQKIEASGTPTDAGNLVISLSFDKGTSVQYDLADVVLLEEANTAGHFWTKLPSDAASAIAAGELDMTNRSTYNAFSFFDRNEGNPNAIIKANNRTVIGLNSGIADIESGKDAIDHRQSRNTISLNEDGTTWSGLYLYLYDMSGNKTDCNAYGPTVDFTMKGAKYDRAFTSGQHSTLFLPFNLTTSQLKAAGFTQLSNINSINSVNSEIVLNTWDLTKETPTDYTALAGQGYIVVAGGSGASLSDFIKPTGGISVQKASNGQTSEATGFVGTYVFGRKYQTEGGYMNYSYQNDKFRPLKSLEDGGATMKPFRAILAVPTSTSAPMFSTSHFYVEDDYVPTNIQTIDMSGEKGGNIYTVDGRLVRTDGTVNSLPRGIYIQNNKKFVVK